MLRFSILAAVATIACATPARADRERRWYGYQTLAPDLAASALAVTALATESSALGIASYAVFVAGAPIVHGLRGHGVNAALSGGMRLLAPFALGALGYYAAYALDDRCDRGGYSGCKDDRIRAAYAPAILSALGAMVVAITLDHAVLAYEPHPAPTAAIVPWISPEHAGLAFRFTM